MAAVIIDIADEIVSTLNSATLSQSFTAERSYVPVRDLKDMGSDLWVAVVAKEIDPTLLDRTGRNIYDYMVDIGIQKIIGSGLMTNDEINTACDPLMELGEEVIKLFFATPLSVVGKDRRPISAKNVPIYDASRLDEKRIFASLVTLTYRIGN